MFLCAQSGKRRQPLPSVSLLLGPSGFFISRRFQTINKFSAPPGKAPRRRLPKHENGGRSRPPVVSCRSLPSAGDLGGAKPTRPSSDLVLAWEKVCEAISAGPVELRTRPSRQCPRRALVPKVPPRFLLTDPHSRFFQKVNFSIVKSADQIYFFPN